jgi:hypothetical protein
LHILELDDLVQQLFHHMYIDLIPWMRFGIAFLHFGRQSDTMWVRDLLLRTIVRMLPSWCHT